MKSSTIFRTLAASSLLALAAWAQPAVAQQVTFTAGGFDNQTVYPVNTSLTGDEAWASNDPYANASYTPTGGTARDIGASDDVFNSGYASGTADNQAYLGGMLNVNGGAVPGHQTVYDYRTFGLGGAATMQFNTDFVVTAPGTGAHDSFGFTFQGANAAVNLFSFNFVPSTAAPTTVDDVTITANGTTAAGLGAASFTLGSRYHLTVNVNVTGGTFTATLTPQNNTGGNNGVAVTIANNTAYAGGVPITDVAATWVLASNANTGGTTPAYTGGGTNGLLFDNYVVTVPEPSTYALLGLGAAALALGLRRRQAQA